MTHCIIMHIYNTVRHKCQREADKVYPLKLGFRNFER
jgi:hypothetical protein